MSELSFVGCQQNTGHSFLFGSRRRAQDALHASSLFAVWVQGLWCYPKPKALSPKRLYSHPGLRDDERKGNYHCEGCESTALSRLAGGSGA